MALQVRPPEDILIQLSDGDWILVKKWLTAGESNKTFTRMVKHIKTGETDKDGKTKLDTDYDIEQMGGLSLAVTYLLDWSAKDLEGKPIVIRDKSPREIEEALLALPMEAYQEVLKAVNEHDDKMREELKARKNAQTSGTESPATSPSVAS